MAAICPQALRPALALASECDGAPDLAWRFPAEGTHYKYIYTYLCVFIYTYTSLSPSRFLSNTYICISIYIYIHIHIHICIYVYVFVRVNPFIYTRTHILDSSVGI